MGRNHGHVQAQTNLKLVKHNTLDVSDIAQMLGVTATLFLPQVSEEGRKVIEEAGHIIEEVKGKVTVVLDPEKAVSFARNHHFLQMVVNNERMVQGQDLPDIFATFDKISGQKYIEFSGGLVCISGGVIRIIGNANKVTIEKLQISLERQMVQIATSLLWTGCPDSFPHDEEELEQHWGAVEMVMIGKGKKEAPKATEKKTIPADHPYRPVHSGPAVTEAPLTQLKVVATSPAVYLGPKKVEEVTKIQDPGYVLTKNKSLEQLKEEALNKRIKSPMPKFSQVPFVKNEGPEVEERRLYKKLSMMPWHTVFQGQYTDEEWLDYFLEERNKQQIAEANLAQQRANEKAAKERKRAFRQQKQAPSKTSPEKKNKKNKKGK
ncbi:MAG: hypothetical protein WC045_00560 [Patescibacteria group bacterium]